ncbi:DUF1489 domain-containing protein [uncultured Albimonas sp.]|uniref:DUF1489 family protein n=1 Tax=uncultured Albimonas sp. TaxID=1331701 RepID=UPI0030EB1935
MRDDLPPETVPRLHIVKLCVGAESVEDLESWQRARAAEALATGRDPRPIHVTRMWPRREDEILSSGGSLYWVIKGVVLARQRIEEMQEVDRGDGVRRCALVLDPEIVRTQPAPRRPFQGWRYLSPEAAPGDLSSPGGAPAGDLPPELARALADLGVR